ncbi:uncharacterized protein DFL_000544 [Arthrobotrys flagrans]|uniref:Uncharacterized protein n=1 Tax=Arthrobotrys flagrans TaxID=97331 RepID=A0A437AEK1_ARTFL|nr:hypothetical protein DFL_000544 [Arthrobotrys flagrans]
MTRMAAELSNVTTLTAQFYIDCSKLATSEPSLNSFGTTDWSNQSLPEAHANFDMVIRKWLTLMQENDRRILGYAVQHTGDPNKLDQTT